MAIAKTVGGQSGVGYPADRPKKARFTGRLMWFILAASTALGAMGLMSEASAQTSNPTAEPIRATETGRVQGLGGEDIDRFLGIPYAAPPTGGQRWRAPAPAPRWSGVRPATQFGSDCFGPQRLRTGSLAPGMSEDCLYLNIWSPHGEAHARRPVMVWVYGGSFVGGTAAMPFYDGTALARRGVVVVTFNYRTGVLGFLAHPGLSRESEARSSGNYGLLDILAVLGWVNRNIESFGGDPRRVTVFGESAGASAIGLLLTSPKSRGLFANAILESPGLLRPLSTLPEAEASGEHLEPELAKLRAMDPDALMALASSAPGPRNLLQPRPMGPIVDGSVLPRSDAEALAQGDLVSTPVIIGSNADEGRLFVSQLPIRSVTDYHAYLQAQFGAAAARVEACYPASSDAEVKPALARVFADNQFSYGIEGYAGALSRRRPPVWRYFFTGNAVEGRPPPTHADELPYVFGVLDPKTLTLLGPMRTGATPADHQLSRQMQSAWVSFASTGNPNAAGERNWQPYHPGGATFTFGQNQMQVHNPGCAVPEAHQ